jgi:arabinofuranan 3-O-arabinosyltransferase
VWLVAFLVLLANDPGRMFFETKLSVDLDPAGFYASLWHLMDPRNTFGALNNQAIGYAMPMGPVYLAGHLAHVPVWLTERLWLSLIIAVGFAGLVKLAEALDIGSPASRLLAGLVFALWPTFTIVIGSTSSAALPGMLAPWAVLPLTTAVRGPGGVVRAAARSGVVVLCMSGVNATVTLEALLLPGLFILAYARGRRLVSLAVCWGGAVVLATAWWVLPLLLQGKYAFNFLPYVEQASTTTGTESAAAALRGAGNWTAYLNLGVPWLPAGWAMVSTPMAIIVGAIAAACGLYGLAMRSLPAGTWLRLCVGLAAAVALAGYGRALGGPFHGPVDHLLDGSLAPFRNVYKLEPVIAAALALGLAHAVATWLARHPGRQATTLQRIYTLEARAVVGVVLIGLMLPYLSGQVLNPGSFTAVPRYWYQVAAYLAAKSPQNTAVVVPGDAHGTYLWGDPIDDPLVALAKSPWAERGLVPYGGAGQRPGRLPAARRRPLPRGAQRPGPEAGGLHARSAGPPDPGAVRLYPGRLVRPADRRQADPAAGDPSTAGGPAQLPGGRGLRPGRILGSAQPGQRPTGQPDRAGERGAGLAPAAHRAASARPRPARHHRRGPGACRGVPARAMGGHRRPAQGRHAVRPGQCQRLLHLHRDRDEPGQRRPTRPDGRPAPAVAAGAGRRAPDSGDTVRRGQRDHIVLRLLDRRHPAGRPGQCLRRQPGDGVGGRQRVVAGEAVDPDRLRRPS